MLDDIIPILKASKTVPIYIRGGEEDSASAGVARDFSVMCGTGCFNCSPGHTAGSLSVNRSYATTVFYGYNTETERWDNPILGGVWSPQDQFYASRSERRYTLFHQLMRSTDMFRNSRAGSWSWWFERGELEDENLETPYLRIWADYVQGRILHVNTRPSRFSTVMRDYLDNHEESELYTRTVKSIPGVYVEPRDNLLYLSQNNVDRDLRRLPSIEEILLHVRISPTAMWRSTAYLTGLTRSLHAMFPTARFDEFNNAASPTGRRSDGRDGMSRLQVELNGENQLPLDSLPEAEEDISASIEDRLTEARERVERTIASSSLTTSISDASSQSISYRDLVRNWEDLNRR